MIKHPLFVVIAVAACIGSGLFLDSSYVEIFGSVMGVINVWLLARQKLVSFLFGLIAVATFAYIYFDSGLYAMVVLSIVQLGFNVYGWYYWVKNKGEEDVTPTTKLSKKGIVLGVSVILIGTLIWSYFQVNYTDASSPYLDSLIAVMGLVAQYLLSKKILENWLLWLAMGVMMLVVYAISGLYVLMVLKVINMCISFDGYLEWRRNYYDNEQKEKTVEAA
ncbi:nicotinamide riboside transporter PnuC [Bacillus cihuensis]|uniref:nicotinamide riboside transporter PnuC n=1 Tax=Bacillus cihuensis TaxID=1208599 RepID=UPI000429DAA7|nr:nicotinamide riboside transporter PnuC [Bacillus cihuensis]